MAENDDKAPAVPWLPLITLIGVGSGVFLFFPQLTSSRPGGGDPRLAGNTFDDQTIDARLWQDPLGVAIADREKSQKHAGPHSVDRFQELLVKKCYEGPAICPLNRELLFAQLAKRIRILAVMIPGGPYVEDVERRLRSRRAVIEGLELAGYDPERDHEIGYFWVPWRPLDPNAGSCVAALEKNRNEDERRWLSKDPWIQPARTNRKEPNTPDTQDTHSLTVPYEWFEPAAFAAEGNPLSHVLVMWLADDAFRDAPLARLADLISWFRLKPSLVSRVLDFVPLPVFAVLGPDNSGTLHKMVMEAKEDPWDSETRKCLATTQIYSSQAAAAESRLLSGIPGGEWPTCKNLIEERVKRLDSGISAFRFDRTVLPDDHIVETLWQELERRGVAKGDPVAIISEEDTYYARALSSTFTNSRPNTTPGSHIYSYTYLRGIDGKLPSDQKDEKETKAPAESGDKNTQSSLRPTEQTEGLNQADDVRRLADELRNLDTSLRPKAVGLLGSDVYDKLELLKALRPVLPEAVFFTNNLDARLAHPDEWNETHNLVVVSAFGLSLDKYKKVAPFRDSGQTALFAATLEAMGQNDDAKPKSPFIFEIARNGPKRLNDPADEGATMAKLSRRYLVPIGCFIAIGISLLAWTWFVTRVASAFERAQTGNLENGGLIGNDDPNGGVKRVEAT